VSGARRFHTDVGAVKSVHAALGKGLAKPPRRDGAPSLTRVGPAPLALARLLNEPSIIATGLHGEGPEATSRAARGLI
jgi:hypothetical protein